MKNDIKVARLVTGEIVLYREVESSEEVVGLQNPHVMMQGPQGPVLAPMMPWAVKGIDYVIPIPRSNFMFWYPEEHCDAVVQSYIAATSHLDLSSLSNVSSLRR